MALSSRSLKNIQKSGSPRAELIFNSEHNQRKWFHKHGKKSFLTLSDDVMARLRQYFNALDSRKNEYISSEDLEDPLIVFGLCQNRAQVQKIVKLIDTDSSGVIEFDEFVQIFKAAKNNKKIKSGKIKFQEFAKIISGSLGKQLESRLCVQTSISQYKRRAIIQFLKKKNQEVMTNGKRIARQIAIKTDRHELLPVLHRFN